MKHRLARRIPPIRSLLDQRDSLGANVLALQAQLDAKQAEAIRAPQMFPPGHYYSPIASLDEVRPRWDQIFATPRVLSEIDLEEAAQLELVRSLAGIARDTVIPETAVEGHRYYFDNDFFSFADGIILAAMLRWLRPRRLVEVGSGFSSALILDINDRYLERQLRCTFIEPEPERLLGLLSDADRVDTEIVVAPLQNVDLSVIDELEAGDVLFIDSSHVSKVGSDVNLIVFELLPRLRAGVFVHVHDIFYPFEYLEVWVEEGRNWNEAYVLRAYLEANAGYRIRLWNSYLATFHKEEMSGLFPLWSRNTGGSLWLERM